MRGVLLEIFKRTPFFGFISMYCSDKYFVACVKRLLLPFKLVLPIFCFTVNYYSLIRYSYKAIYITLPFILYILYPDFVIVSPKNLRQRV